ncbi:MAG: ATP-binding protein, partial [Pseudonocardia sp.]
LRLDAEALRDPAEAERLSTGVEAVQAAVTRAIEQARRRGPEPARSCDAAAAVRERVAFWAVLAEDTDRALTVAIADGPLPVPLPRADLEAAVDALLGNVFAHTPDGTPFSVTLRGGGTVELVVADDGPGLPDPAAADRGASRAGSTGLGLDIARRAAEAAGGALLLDSAGQAAGSGRDAAGTWRGLRVTLRMARAAV